MQKNIYKFLSMFLAFGLILTYQNCGEFTTNTEFGSVNNIGEESFISLQCSDPSNIGTSNLNRLSRAEYLNTISDLFGSSILTLIRNATDLLPTDKFESLTHFMDSKPSASHIESYLNLGLVIADEVLKSASLKTKVFGNCTTNNVACTNIYLNSFAEKIFRRPLAAAEKTEAQSVFSKGTSTDESLKLVLAYHLQSPAFLLKLEFGSANTDQSIFDLTAYEVATKISYQITESTPDDLLYNLAKSGQILDPTVLRTEIVRLFSTPRGKKTIQYMFRQLLEITEVPSFTGFPAAVKSGKNITGLGQAMVDDFEHFINDVVWDKKAGTKELFSSNQSSTQHSELLKIYQRSVAGVGPSNRLGLINKALFLSSTSERTDLIKRGVVVQRNLLCKSLPSPSKIDLSDRNNEAIPAPEQPNFTTLELVAHQTKPSACMGCHSSINPTGAVFELFGPFGEIRSKESTFDLTGSFVKSIDLRTKSDVPVTYQTNQTFSNSLDMAEYFAESKHVKACLSQKVFEYMQKRNADSADDCHKLKIFDELNTENESLLEAFVSSVGNSAVYKRRKD